MTRLSNRLPAVLFAASLFAAFAAPAFAQQSPTAATVGPAGGVGSTTAPSNSQGTPAGGTGVISTTRVGPSGAATSMATPHRVMRRRHYYRHARHYTRRHTTYGTQSTMGKNGASAPAVK